MPRVNVPAQTTPGAYPTLPIGANTRDLAMQAGQTSGDGGNYTVIVQDKTIVIVQNTDVGAQTVTFSSVADALNRTGDITAYSIGAGEIALFGPFKLVGWTNGGQLWLHVSDATVKIAVISVVTQRTRRLRRLYLTGTTATHPQMGTTQLRDKSEIRRRNPK